jgi:hypothetical protein
MLMNSTSLPKLFRIGPERERERERVVVVKIDLDDAHES